MTLHTTAARRAIRRVARIWSELDHAQRRLVEVQAGIEPRVPRGRRGH